MNTLFEFNISKLNVKADEKYFYLTFDDKVELKISFEGINTAAKYIIGLKQKQAKIP